MGDLVKLIGNDPAYSDPAAYGQRLTHSRFVAAISGTVNIIQCYPTVNGNAKFAMYSDAAGEPSVLLGQSANSALVAGASRSVSISPVAIVAGTAYWLSVAFSSDVRLGRVASGGPYRFRSITYSPDYEFPNPAEVGYTAVANYALLIGGYGTTGGAGRLIGSKSRLIGGPSPLIGGPSPLIG